IKEFLNGEFLTISNLDNYVDNGYIVLPSSNQSNDTLANGIKTAWSGGDGVDNTSRIFLLASRYGFTNKGKSSETGEVALNESSQAKYYSQHFAIEDYLGSSNTTYLLNGKLYNGGDMTCEDSKLKYFTGMGGYSFSWWLRSGDFDINYRTSAYSVGGVGYVGSYNANRSDLSLRPCFILNLA
ncbi:MAG: hypothetical protein IKT27_04880, partial [Clostridia bacterium]|nr:hypothetical protein [Clostridia bacterium]